MRMWVLVVEDEKRLSDLLFRGLKAEGWTVDLASDGLEGEEMARVNAYDAMVVDWRLPRRDGRTMIQNLRAAGVATPALMLTVLSDVEHKVAGLDAGADDYLSKPFSFEELLARLRAITRRPATPTTDHTLVLGSLVLNTERRTTILNGQELILRPKEYSLLEVFLRRHGVVLSRNTLAERVWGSAMFVSDNVLDVTISGLRRQLRSVDSPDVRLETIRGVGYRLRQVQAEAD